MKISVFHDTQVIFKLCVYIYMCAPTSRMWESVFYGKVDKIAGDFLFLNRKYDATPQFRSGAKYSHN